MSRASIEKDLLVKLMKPTTMLYEQIRLLQEYAMNHADMVIGEDTGRPRGETSEYGEAQDYLREKQRYRNRFVTYPYEISKEKYDNSSNS